MARGTRRKKNKINTKVLLALALAVVFVASIIIYYINSYNVTEREYAVYSSMEEPTFPVIHAVVADMEINKMHGYLQDLGNEAAGDSITPLPENRHLSIVIDPYEMDIAGIEYEIKSLDLTHFIEKTELTSFRKKDGRIFAELPIQNLIEKDTKYLLKIKLKTGAEEINYYTRICQSTESYVNQMLEMATSFTRKTFDYNEARELAAYLEADPKEKNDDLSTVTVGSNFSQLTWADSKMKLTSELDVTIKEYDGIMYAIEINYDTESVSETDNIDKYRNTDEYTLRSGEERIYLMNYERKTNQVFEGNKHLFAGQRINLGIVNDENVETQNSENKRYISFVDNKELWVYDQESKIAVNVFSFRSEIDKDRASCMEHGIKVLETSNLGTVDFVVFGYMNRGRHEGMNGIVYYSYDINADTLTENLFIPLARCFEKIKLEADELCIKNDSAMFYLKQNDAIIAIDLTSLEIVDIVSGLSDKSYVISKDQKRVAWLSAGSDNTSSIKILDVDTGLTQTIKAKDGEYLGIEGFQSRDLLYGVSSTDNEWLVHGKTVDLPYEKLIIVGDNLEEIIKYQKPGRYISDITLEGNRFHFNLFAKTEAGKYKQSGSDTLVCKENSTGTDNRKQKSRSDLKKTIYHIAIDKPLKSTKGLKVKAPENISYENAGIIELGDRRNKKDTIFYAYANGKLLGTTKELPVAIRSCYDEMGFVRDGNGVLVFNRANKTAIKTISEPNIAAQKLMLEYQNYDSGNYQNDGILIMQANGLSYDMLLSYVYSNHPVMLVMDNGEYCLIYGYDNNHIRLYYPSLDDEQMSRKEKITRDEAEVIFNDNDNDFICFTDYKG